VHFGQQFPLHLLRIFENLHWDPTVVFLDRDAGGERGRAREGGGDGGVNSNILPPFGVNVLGEEEREGGGLFSAFNRSVKLPHQFSK
jgi:hypothetical protein